MPRGPKQPYAIDPRQLPSGRWKGRVIIYDVETGKGHELTQTFDTKREAKNWAEKEAAAYRDDPNRRPPSEESLEAYLNRWLNDVAAGRVRDTTLIAYRRYVKPILDHAGRPETVEGAHPPGLSGGLCGHEAGREGGYHGATHAYSGPERSK